MNRKEILGCSVRNYAKVIKAMDNYDRTCDSVFKKIDRLPDEVARSVEKTLASRS